MNAEEYRFLILNTERLWKQGKIEQDADGNDSLRIGNDGISLRGYHTHVLTDRYALGNLSPVDFALDGCGLAFLLDSVSKGIIVFDPNTGEFERVRCLTFGDPKAIVVNSKNVYVADGSQVMCLARANYQIRWIASIEGAVLSDLATDDKSNVYVLDANGRQVIAMDRTGKATKIELSVALEDPVAVAVSAGKLYVLEGARQQVLRFSTGGTLEATMPPLAVAGLEPFSLAVDSEGNLYLGDGGTGGNSYQIDPSGKATLIGYQGPCLRLALNGNGDLFLLGEGELAFLKLVTRYVSKGAYVSDWFDSVVPDCQWHKVVLEAGVPANTRLSVSHYISNDATLPPIPAWSEPVVNFTDALINGPRGRYIWFRVELLSDDLHGSTPVLHSLRAYFPRLSYLRYLPATYQEDEKGREFLERFLSLFETFFSDLEGEIAGLARYLDSKGTPDTFLPWLQAWLALARDENWSSEKVRRLIAMAPDLYRRRGTRQGLEQMLELYTGDRPIIVENFQMDCLGQKVAKTRLARAASAGDSCISVADSSLLRAEDIIKVGDSNGEEFAVIDHIDANVLGLRGKLHADYDARALVRLVSVEEALYGNCPFQFCVLLKPGQVRDTSEFNAVKRIVEREKPAHTVAGVRSLQPWVYLNMHTYLGINTLLTEPVFVVGQSSALSRDTALGDREQSGQAGLHSRVAIDTRLT